MDPESRYSELAISPPTIDALTLSALLADADVPPDVVTSTIDLGGYQSPPGVYVTSDSPAQFARALVALSEAIGQGAALEAKDLTVTSTGGSYGGARTLTAHLPGWTLDGPIVDMDDEAEGLAEAS